MVATMNLCQFHGIWSVFMEWFCLDSINTTVPSSMIVADSTLYANFTGYGLYSWNGSAWSRINTTVAASMVATGTDLYANFTGYGLYKWNGTVWTKINAAVPASMVATGTDLYANFMGYGLYKWNGTVWTKINAARSGKHGGLRFDIIHLFNFTGWSVFCGMVLL